MDYFMSRRPAFIQPPSQVLPTVLPPNFAQQVLDLQSDLNLNCQLEVILRLQQLYKEGVQHYQSRRDSKYLYYQDRLQTLLSRKDVLETLQNPHLRKKRRSTVEAIKDFKEKSTQRHRLLSEKANYQLNKGLVAQRSAQKTLQQFYQQASTLAVQMQKNLSKQCETLEERQEMRNRRKLGECDVSGGVPNIGNIEESKEETKEENYRQR